MARFHHKVNRVRPSEAGNDPYAALGVPRDTDDQSVRRAYLDLVRKHPPERDQEMFKRIRAAYERLETSQARAAARIATPEMPPGDSLTMLPPPSGPAILGIPLQFLLQFDPFSDLALQEDSKP